MDIAHLLFIAVVPGKWLSTFDALIYICSVHDIAVPKSDILLIFNILIAHLSICMAFYNIISFVFHLYPFLSEMSTA